MQEKCGPEYPRIRTLFAQSTIIIVNFQLANVEAEYLHFYTEVNIRNGIANKRYPKEGFLNILEMLNS